MNDSNGTEYHNRFWRELDQLKVHSLYLSLLLKQSESIDRKINMILAISSSTSIGAWVIWQDYSNIWASIIALSQVINAIKPHLPYKKRISALYKLTNEMDALFIAMEYKWFDVAEGRLTIDEIHSLHMDFKQKIGDLDQKYLGQITLPDQERLYKKASEQAKYYFQTFYSH